MPKNDLNVFHAFETLNANGVKGEFADLAKDSIRLISEASALVWKMYEEVKAAKAAKAAGTEGVKVETPKHAFDVNAEKDEGAMKTAHQLLNTFVAAANKAITKNVHVAFHLSKLDGALQKFFTDEVNFQRFDLGRKDVSPFAMPVSASDAAINEKKQNIAEISAMIRFVEGGGFFKYDVLPAEVKTRKTTEGKTQLSLPNLRGMTKDPAASYGPHGYKYNVLSWQFGEETLPPKTEIKRIIRLLWPGLERIDRKPDDVDALIAKANGGEKKLKDGQTVEFKHNGVVVKVTQITPEQLAALGISEEDEDDEEEEETEEEEVQA